MKLNYSLGEIETNLKMMWLKFDCLKQQCLNMIKIWSQSERQASVRRRVKFLSSNADYYTMTNYFRVRKYIIGKRKKISSF